MRLAIAQLRELDLQLPFARPRVLRKDVEDQHRAIDDRQWHDLLEIATLARAQIVEHHQHVGAAFLRERSNFGSFAAADQHRRIDVRQLLDHLADDLDAGRTCERGKLRELRCERRAAIAGIDGHEQCALRRRGDRAQPRAAFSIAISHASPSL